MHTLRKVVRNGSSWVWMSTCAWGALTQPASAQTTEAAASAEIAPPETTPPPETPAAFAAPPPPAGTVPGAFVAVAPPPPAAAGINPTVTGSFFTRYELRANYEENGVSRARFLEGDAVFYRMRLGLATGMMDVGKDLKVGLQFTPQASGVVGELGNNTVADAALNMHEAYTRVAGSRLSVDLGRFEMNYGDALILGNLGWHQTARSFDGVRSRYASAPKSYWVDTFFTILDEGGDSGGHRGITDGDIYFYGLYADWGPLISSGLALDTYVLMRSWNEQTDVPVDAVNPAALGLDYKKEGAHEATFGVRAKQKLDVVDYRFEGNFQVGQRPGAAPTFDATTGTASGSFAAAQDVLAYHVDAEVGATFGDFRAAVEGLYASGDDPTSGKNEGFSSLFPTAHKWLGLSDVFHQGGEKRTNVVSGVLHLSAAVVEGLKLDLDTHLFSRLEKLAGEDGYAGTEVDFGAAYGLAKGLTLRGLYALFLGSDDFYPAGGLPGDAEPIHYAELELAYNLK